MRYTAGVIAAIVLVAICAGLWRELGRGDEEVVADARIEFQPTDYERTREAIQRELASAEESAHALALAKAKVESELQAARRYHEFGKRTLNAFRSAFQTAESRGSYPVKVAGSALTREDLLERAYLSLAVQESSAEFLPTYQEALASIDMLQSRVDAHIETASMMTSYLDNDRTRQEFERDRSKLRLLARQVETLANDGNAIQNQIDMPVPKLGEMIRTMNIEEPEAESDARVLEFLSSRKDPTSSD